MTAASSDTPQRVERLCGLVVKGPFGAGTRSQREAYWLETDQGRYVLRRKAGPGFGSDPALEKWLGQRVRCSGFLTGYQLLAERVEREP
jgi:hypothetical protein